MTRKQELFKAAYADVYLAADALSDMASKEAPFDQQRIHAVRRTLQSATAAITTLESLLAGNPEPKRGD